MYQAPSVYYRGAVQAILVAGPAFMIALGAASFYLRLPEPIAFEPAMLIVVPTILLFALMFGPFISCVPILIGATIMDVISVPLPVFRIRAVWLLVGLGIGWGFSWIIGAAQEGAELTFALTATSGLCAWLSHRRVTD